MLNQLWQETKPMHLPIVLDILHRYRSHFANRCDYDIFKGIWKNSDEETDGLAWLLMKGEYLYTLQPEM